MPITFRDEDLERHASIVGFRERNEGENIKDFRASLANYMQPIDPIEAQEIRSGLPWDKWGDADTNEVVTRNPETLCNNPMIITKVLRRRHIKQ